MSQAPLLPRLAPIVAPGFVIYVMDVCCLARSGIRFHMAPVRLGNIRTATIKKVLLLSNRSTVRSMVASVGFYSLLVIRSERQMDGMARSQSPWVGFDRCTAVEEA